jgi:all-trans-retinol 13,14-reductase
MRADNFDAIVVGSGIGGLTVASLLAQLRGARVLVLERHYRLGGFTHAFTRPGGQRWDVGLHYVGEMGKGDRLRRIMDFVTGGSVAWQPMPSPFERYTYPDLTIDQPSDRQTYLNNLMAIWPEERRGIERYFNEVEVAAAWFAGRVALASSGRKTPAQSSERATAAALRTTADTLDVLIRSPELRAVLASQWGNYGLPPGRSAFVAHAVTVSHYLSGGWFPVGGSATIAESARKIIERAGGQCLINHEVAEILIEHGRAVGVAVRNGARGDRLEFRAPVVVSNAGARVTYEQLLSLDTAPRVRAARLDLQRFPTAYGVVQLFLGLKESARSLGFRGENHWIFESFDHDTMWARRNDLLTGYSGGAYLSFPSLKDPSARQHTAEIIAPLDHAALLDWHSTSWHRRGQDYSDLKQTITRALLDLVERYHPGFGDLVAYHELATPLTVTHFTGHPEGAIYGMPAVPERFSTDFLGPITPVQGLLLAGSDACIHGIAGAMMGGVVAAAAVLGASGFQRVLSASATARGSTLPLC